jgi:hypothetical protein
MFQKKKFIVVIISAVLIAIGSSPLSKATDPNSYTTAITGTDVLVVLAADSTISISASSVDVHNNVYTFTNFDPQISTDKVPDPENYVLTSSGVLLQAKSRTYPDSSEYSTALTQLIALNNIVREGSNDPTTVTDHSAVKFTFETDPGANTVSIDFMLGSGEYFEGDWDLAGIYIDGINYAYLPNGKLLRVNSSAQITNVCTYGSAGGCYASDYEINGVILGTISPKLTMYAALSPDLAVHTFVAIVANTDDTILPSSLLLSNFQSFGVAQQLVSTFSYGIQIEEEVAVVTVKAEPVPDPIQMSEITGTSVSSPDAGNNVTITILGKFPQAVRNVDVNDRRISLDSWMQDSSTITFTVPATASGSYAVQIWNGSLPLLQVQTIVIVTS